MRQRHTLFPLYSLHSPSTNKLYALKHEKCGDHRSRSRSSSIIIIINVIIIIIINRSSSGSQDEPSVTGATGLNSSVKTMRCEELPRPFDIFVCIIKLRNGQRGNMSSSKATKGDRATYNIFKIISRNRKKNVYG